ncbi:19780_t:CDS:2 [Funneliformis geosporum]|uniref:19780_t:CDS:1 n=1 Tax=Funneliformis geosporum TaxID=1117311 RepID=A0A9W4SQ86_9GLOM|nr:19780_t:CDS:2 [Funneliformis geosporum]
MDEEISEKTEKTFVTVEATSIPEQIPQIIEPPKQEQQEEIQSVQEWHELFSEFFTKIGMVETNKALLMELIVLSTNHEKQIPKHIDCLLKELTTLKTRFDVQSSKRKMEQENGEGNPSKKVQLLMSSQEVQIRTTNSELEQRIDNFIQLKKSEINDSNRAEFLKKSDNPLDPNDKQSCARSDAAEINRNIQMKLDVVNNEDGPLARSTFTSANHNRSDLDKKSLADLPRGIEDRLQNIEKHLNIEIVTSIPFSVYERLKVLENKIMQLERDYPPWSAIHFNQPNRQFPPPPPVTTVRRNSNNEIITSVVQTPGNNTSVSTVTPTFSAAPTISASLLVDAKRSPSGFTPTNLFGSKGSRTPRPIKPKGRGRGQSSLTRSVMEQLKLIPPQLPKVQIQSQRASQVQVQSSSRPQTQHSSLQPHVRQLQLNSPKLPQLLSTNKSSITPIPIAPKPPTFQLYQQQQQLKKIIAEEMQASEILIVREDRSMSPIIDPGSNNEAIPNKDSTMEIDAAVEQIIESNGAKNSHDTSSGEESSVVNESYNHSMNSTGTTVLSNNFNTTTIGLVSNIDESKGLEQIQN